MLWRTSPAATELEEVSLAWLRRLLRPSRCVRRRHLRHRVDLQPSCTCRGAAGGSAGCARAEAWQHDPIVGALRVYCSEQAHSSIDKAVLTLGLGQSSLRRIPVDEEFCMRADSLACRARGRPARRDHARRGRRHDWDDFDHSDRSGERGGRYLPAIIVSGCTSTRRTQVSQRCCQSARRTFAGWDRADSIVVNPHKWLFTPFDLSAFYCRRMEVVREAFSLVPEYLKTTEGRRGARNLMDTGIQLGRRFRSLKLWMILRHFGAARLREHSRGAHPSRARVRRLGR